LKIKTIDASRLLVFQRAGFVVSFCGMYGKLQDHLRSQIQDIRDKGLFKSERIITSPQNAHVGVTGRKDVLNLCANNYLGLADHPRVIAAAKKAIDDRGNGLASVRFICGTQDIHKQLEKALSSFLGTEDTILFGSCWDANGGLFEILLGPEDAVISDELNHASIIDGIRLCKAQRLRYKNNDPVDLEAKLKEAATARHRLIITDGVFSMDGSIANLPAITALAEKYDAVLAVDDSHAVGFIGKTGRGTHEFHNVMGKVDIITGTLGKALGGASGGYVSGRQEVVDLLRQRARPYLFSNSVPPSVVGASLEALKLANESDELRTKLRENTAYFRSLMSDLKFDLLPGEHPIVPVMFGDAVLAARVAEEMLKRGVYVVAFSYPVVPMGKARIRTQVSAAHSREDLKFAAEMFNECRAAVQ
jgi:glycine C-acetyltransferase